jgi:hypothetical protein
LVTAPIAGLEVKKHCAGHVLAAQGLVVKHVDVAEGCIVVAAVGLKSWPSGKSGLEHRSRRARGQKAPRGARTCRPRSRGKTR